MKFDITNLELDAVLVALYNAARIDSTTFLGDRVPTLSHRIARSLLEEETEKENLYFGRLMARELYIDLNDDLVDLARYDAANGLLAGARALFSLCQQVGVEPVLRIDGQADAVIVTEEWLASYGNVQRDLQPTESRHASRAMMSRSEAMNLTLLADNNAERMMRGIEENPDYGAALMKARLKQKSVRRLTLIKVAKQ